MTGEHPSPAIILPHSYPFILIDKIIEREEGKRIVCLKNVTFNEEFFQGHFKDNPVMPGLLIIEAMAQASGLIIKGGKPAAAYMSGVKEARFRKPVFPGDQLVIKASLTDKLPPLYVFGVVSYVKDELVSEARITLTIL